MCSKNEPSVFDNMVTCGGCGGGVFPDDRQELDCTGNLAHFECLSDIRLREDIDAAESVAYEAHKVAYNAEHGTNF